MPRAMTAPEMGRKGGTARWAKVPLAERSALMRRVIQARWATRRAAASAAAIADATRHPEPRTPRQSRDAAQHP